MLHAKFLESRFSGYREDFQRVFTIYGRGREMQKTNFCSPYPRMLYIKFGFDWPSSF